VAQSYCLLRVSNYLHLLLFSYIVYVKYISFFMTYLLYMSQFYLQLSQLLNFDLFYLYTYNIVFVCIIALYLLRYFTCLFIDILH